MAANNNADHEPNSGLADTIANNTAYTSAPRKTPDDPRKASTPSRTQPANSLARVASPSPASSPRNSRNASPIRKESKPQPLSTPLSTQPSAAAIQRALSAANPPQLQQGSASDSLTRLPRPQKSGGTSGDSTPHWPTSPRLKSPPPSAANSRKGSAPAPKKPDTVTTPSINVQSATPQTTTPPQAKQSGDDTSKINQLQPSGKGPSRGASGKSTLETVQENSADDIREPSPAALAAAAELKSMTKLSDDENSPARRENAAIDAETTVALVESGSESASTKSPRKRDHSQSSQRPKNGAAKSYASLTSTKSRQGEGKQNMTVETETVPSVPQSALNVGDRPGRGESSGSVRHKPSSDTIRPKKERKKPSQKARSINQSTTSSKSDIFEQRVANAVDEANSSESDETFVYESNPPEPQRRVKQHSRTPSVTSSHSMTDQQRVGIRSFGDAMEDNRRVGGKRSMKFSNNAYNETNSPDGKDGSVRSHTPRHFGRFGRGGSHQSMFDPDSPFTQASRLRSSQRSKPSSPRSPLVGQQRSSGVFGRKQERSYDFDAEIGDDERTPLVGSVRSPRSSRITSRRIQRSPSIDEYYGVRRRSRCGRYGGFLLAFVVVIVVIFSTVIFLAMSNRPLYDVEILQISNVLASEQELIMDLLVSAVNPNALSIAITDMDVDIFAKSKHVASSTTRRESSPTKSRRKRAAPVQAPKIDRSEGWQDLSRYWHSTSGGVDDGTDPPDDGDLEPDAQTMLLGRVYNFDQGLSFEASPLQRHAHNSTSELRLAQPGNKTETGGSERWERVLQHDFELIVRGSLKYQLPISSRLQLIAVGKCVVVHPEGEIHDECEIQSPKDPRQRFVVEEAKAVSGP